MTISTFTPELWVGLMGVILGASSLIVSLHFNRKAINQASEALEQADKNLKIQLLYEDKKKALMALEQIINESNYKEIKEKMANFLLSFGGKYAPQEVVFEINKKICALEEFEDEHSPYPTGREPDDEPYPFDYVDDFDLGMNEYDKYDYNLKIKTNDFKNSVKQIITNSLTKI